MKFWNFLRNTLRTWLALDYRSLALLRMGIGLTILFDLIERSTSLFAHYTDGGVLPRSELFRLWGMDWTVSLHLASGELWFQILLFVIAGIFALFLIFGYRTKLASVVSWFLLISLQARNPMVLQGGDVVFRTTVFFMMFLPLGRVWSLDRLFNRVPRPTEKIVVGFETLAYITQICLLYIFTGILKTGPAWHADGTAVYYALNVDQLITPLGAWLRNIPAILPFFTHAVWIFETFGVLLFFIPWKNWIFRLLGILGFIALQIGFNVSMRLGLFGMITITTLFGLIPSEFWDNLFSPCMNKLRKRGKTGLTIIYDFDCSFCHKASFLIARVLLLHPETKIISSTENETGRLVMEQENSWVIIDKTGAIYTGFRGMISVFEHSPYAKIFAPILNFVLFRNYGEKIYRFVANRRKLVCSPEPAEKPLPHFQETMRGWVLLFCTFYIIGWNIETLGKYSVIPQQLRPFATITRLDQEFNMFAPTPLIEDGWYVMPGKLRNGTMVDVFSGASPVSYEKPQWVAYTYKDQRWQKYLMNLWSSNLSEFRLGYGKYLCRTWNKKHLNTNEELLSFDIIFMLERTPEPGKPQTPIEPTTIWHHECF
jgi:predicted DCC family thiol-disulfide oxidoreductase YuxK